MAYLPSHQELASHPKTRKAARQTGMSLPTMIGHLHLLWWWALDHAPDGDLGKYDADDLADAAMWEGDPEAFVKALRECGSAGGEGFLHADGKLHDWAEYGGKYGKRVAAARKAAAARWDSESSPDAERPQSASDAEPMRSHSGCSANASPAHARGNAEERRGEEKNLGGKPREPDLLFEAVAEACGIDWRSGLTKSGRGPLVKAVADLRDVGASPEDVAARSGEYRRRFVDAALTPSALAKHWPSLAPANSSQRRRGGVTFDAS